MNRVSGAGTSSTVSPNSLRKARQKGKDQSPEFLPILTVPLQTVFGPLGLPKPGKAEKPPSATVYWWFPPQGNAELRIKEPLAPPRPKAEFARQQISIFQPRACFFRFLERPKCQRTRNCLSPLAVGKLQRLALR